MAEMLPSGAADGGDHRVDRVRERNVLPEADHRPAGLREGRVGGAVPLDVLDQLR
jgi:hypothetical protein